MDTLRTVELRTAYVFDCEDCGRENVVRGVPCDPPEALAAEAEDGDERAEWVTIPAQVKCRHCGAEFRTTEV